MTRTRVTGWGSKFEFRSKCQSHGVKENVDILFTDIFVKSASYHSLLRRRKHVTFAIFVRLSQYFSFTLDWNYAVESSYFMRRLQ